MVFFLENTHHAHLIHAIFFTGRPIKLYTFKVLLYDLEKISTEETITNNVENRMRRSILIQDELNKVKKLELDTYINRKKAIHKIVRRLVLGELQLVAHKSLIIIFEKIIIN